MTTQGGYPADEKCQVEGCMNVATCGTPLPGGGWEWVCRAHYRRPGRPFLLKLVGEGKISTESEEPQKDACQTRIPIPDTETCRALRLPHFDGFPYLATYVVPTFYHVILLPLGLDPEEMTRIAVHQATFNRLQTCLVLGEESCVYFGKNGSQASSDCVPGCSNWVTDRLLPGPILVEDEELKGRKERLRAFIKAATRTGYLFGDLTKGGRPATEEEKVRLAGFSARAIPKGLTHCGVCGGWRGECLDPKTDVFKDKVMKVYCRCQNDNLCARCGRPLYEYKLNANFYGEDGHIWHVPGFCGLQHRCADIQKLNIGTRGS
jgi:hypothetical protein